MISSLLLGIFVLDDFEYVKTVRLMHEQLRYAGCLWDVSAWSGPGREGHADYVVIQADGKEVFSTKEAEEPSRLGIGFLSGADGVPYIVYRTYSYAGSGAWTKIFRMRQGRKIELIFSEDSHDDVFHSARDIGGPVFRDLDADGREEWIWDDFSSYDGSGPAESLIAFKPDVKGVLKVWKRMPNRHGTWLPRLSGVAGEGDNRIHFVAHGTSWFK